MASNAQNAQKKKKNWLIPLCILASAALIAGIVLLSNAERKNIVISTLETFYTALYVDGDWEALNQCMAPDARADFESVMTMGGVNVTFFRNYIQDAVQEIGEGFSVSVRLTELSEYGANELATIRRTFSNAEKALLAAYEIVFTAADGEEHIYTNEMILIQEGGRWYMTSHLSLPIGVNMSVE